MSSTLTFTAASTMNLLASRISISSLPTELWIQVFSYLPVPSLVVVSCVSKGFHAFFNDPQNGTPIWRNACLLHGLVSFSIIDSDVDGHATIAEEPPRREWGRWRDWERKKHAYSHHGEVKWSDALDVYSEQSLVGALDSGVDWKGLVKRRLAVNRSWFGQLPSDVVRYEADEPRFSGPASKSYLAILHQAMVLAGSVPPDEWSREDVEQLTDDELQSPSEMLKRRLKKIKAVLGFPKDYDQPLSANTAHDLLMMETQWVEMLRFELPKTIGKVVPSMKNVHRIKIDERNGFMLTTHRDGGLVVADIQTKEILWCLPKNYVHEYAHLEYEQGYFIFDRTDGSKEVWRSSSIPPPSSICIPAKEPDQQQRVAEAFANGDDDSLLRSLLAHDSRIANPTVSGVEWGAIAPTKWHERGDGPHKMGIKDLVMAASWFRIPQAFRRQTMFGWINIDDLRRFLGYEPEVEAPDLNKRSDNNPNRLSPQFVPHMIIPVPHAAGDLDMTRAYRFVYPYLLAASQSRAYIWDMRTGEQVQVVESTQEFAVPDHYPVSPDTPPPASESAKVDKGKANVRLNDEMEVLDDGVDEGEVEKDGNFPVYRPFKSGFFDENATYSGNYFSPVETRQPVASSTQPDPLSIRMNPPRRLEHLFYVELSERWIFACGGEGLRVFARGKELFDHSDVLAKVKQNLGYDLGPGQLALRVVSDRIHYSRWHASVGKESFRGHWGSELVRQQLVWNEEVQFKTEDEANRVLVPQKRRRPAPGRRTTEQSEPARRRLKLFDEVLAVHVSPDQRHFVAMFSSSRLLFVPDFERVIGGEGSVWDDGVEIQLGPVNVQSVYLSYGGGESGSGGSAGRISVVTEAGIFIIAPFFNQPGFPSGRKVDFTVHRLAPSFMDPKRLRDISCLQMSDTGLWVNWHVPDPPRSWKLPNNWTNPHTTGPRARWFWENGYLPLSVFDQPSAVKTDHDQDGSGAVVDAGGGTKEEEDGGEHKDEEADDEALQPYPGHDSDVGAQGVMQVYNDDEVDGEDEDDWEDVDVDVEMEDEESESEQDFSWASSSVRGPETFTFTQRRGKTWKTSSWYPMVAMEVPDEERARAQAAQPTSGPKPTTILPSADKGKGKQPEPWWSSLHPDNKPRRWVNQIFPLNETPPSQYSFDGGPCKWNFAERTGDRRRALSSEEKTAVDLDIVFQLGLAKARVDKWGSPREGALDLADGDLVVRTDGEDFPHRVARRREVYRFEVHQIRFVPM
ncbi:hypothetical protein FA13DRAFT_1816688 [Coprinellus micaceus]|uniref:F-box domain-containing protein n=1 Tax=Coprinellus micaceus TaxID=71717 RepID=A0A4Y7SXU7_COPMI|nr:hypothetical protein FA13DRAFT_1816688 [Coprinellus micaceus]